MEEWQQQWNAFKDFLHSREGKSAREFAQWIQDTDIFVGTETLNRNELMRFSTTVGCKPTFTTVCYFARETKDDKAVELACQAASSSTERTPDFIKALGGAESKFGTFFTNLVHGVSGQNRPPQQAPAFKGAKRSVGLLPGLAAIQQKIERTEAKLTEVENAMSGGGTYMGISDPDKLYEFLKAHATSVAELRKQETAVQQTVVDSIRQPKRQKMDDSKDHRRLKQEHAFTA
ncbi:unnamed protein product [Ectocarpus sp. 4 AP-2014]